MNRNYKLIVEDCKVLNLDINHSFDFLKVYKNTMADSIVIRNCQFENITGNVLALDKETEELGIYNAEYVVLENNTFKDIQKTVLNLLRGGTDESTSGPNLTINNCQFENIGHGKRNKIKAAICLHGVQVTNISNLTFSNSEAFKMHLTLNGEPITVIKDVTFKDSKGIVSNSDQYKKEGIVKL